MFCVVELSCFETLPSQIVLLVCGFVVRWFKIVSTLSFVILKRTLFVYMVVLHDMLILLLTVYQLMRPYEYKSTVLDLKICSIQLALPLLFITVTDDVEQAHTKKGKIFAYVLKHLMLD